MMRLFKLNQKCVQRIRFIGAICCGALLLGLGQISLGDMVGLSDLPTMPPAFGAKLSAPVEVEAANVRAFKPLASSKSIGQRRDEVQAKATVGMKPGCATAGGLMVLKRIPAVDPIVTPKLPLFRGERPDFHKLDFDGAKCKRCGSDKKCRACR